MIFSFSGNFKLLLEILYYLVWSNHFQSYRFNKIQRALNFKAVNATQAGEEENKCDANNMNIYGGKGAFAS